MARTARTRLQQAWEKSIERHEGQDYGTVNQPLDSPNSTNDLEAQQDTNSVSSGSSLSTDTSEGLRSEVRQKLDDERLYNQILGVLAWLYVLGIVATSVYLLLRAWLSVI